MELGKRKVHFYVTVGLNAQDNVYVKVGDYTTDRSAFFKPKETRNSSEHL